MAVETFNLKYESPVLILRIDYDISARGKSNKRKKNNNKTINLNWIEKCLAIEKSAQSSDKIQLNEKFIITFSCVCFLCVCVCIFSPISPIYKMIPAHLYVYFFKNISSFIQQPLQQTNNTEKTFGIKTTAKKINNSKVSY